MAWEEVEARISEAIGARFRARRRRCVSGGCINDAHVVSGDGRTYFVKTNECAAIEMFRAEAEGLAQLAGTGELRVPRPVCTGSSDEFAYLVVEHLALRDDPGTGAERLGRGLARLHRHTAPRFGWERDNTIGATPQPNPWMDDWIDFFRTQRLAHQFALAAGKGHAGAIPRKGGQLLQRIREFFPGYAPVASLVHGDLWGGNWAVDEHGDPVIFDPAVYYGDRETDLAMTELFGRFPPAFYTAYNDEWPLDEGYRVRATLYKLYHVLNHLNLFGGGYAAQAEHMIDTLLGLAK